MNNNKFKQTEIGEIPEDWKVETMAQICDVVTDYVANGSFASLKSHVKYNNAPDHAILVRLADYNKNFQGDFVYINKEGYEYLKKSRLVGGEIIISNVGEYSGTVFRTPFLNQPMTLGPNSITIKTKHNDSFFYYWLTSIYGQSAINNIKGGSAVPKFNKTDFKTILAPRPPINEQQQIVSVLSSIDNKIELNKKMNKTLEEIGKTLFKSWFVDFEFPNNDSKPYKSNGGKMVDSELGEIPEGWEIGCLPDVAKIQKGLSYSGKDLAESGSCALVGLKCFERKGGFRIDGIKYYNGKFKNDHLLETGDLVVAMTDLTQGAEVIGNPALVPFIPNVDKAVASLDISIIKPISCLSREYLYLQLTRQESQDFLYGYTNGSTVLHLSIKGLYEFKLLIPPKELLDKFNVLIENMFFQIRKNQHENINLTALRDSFLPRLMSGKLRVN